MPADPPVFAVFRRLRFPSGRTIRKFVRVKGSTSCWTENPRHRWTTTDRARAEKMAEDYDGEVVEVKLPRPPHLATLPGMR